MPATRKEGRATEAKTSVKRTTPSSEETRVWHEPGRRPGAHGELLSHVSARGEDEIILEHTCVSFGRPERYPQLAQTPSVQELCIQPLWESDIWRDPPQAQALQAGTGLRWLQPAGRKSGAWGWAEKKAGSLLAFVMSALPILEPGSGWPGWGSKQLFSFQADGQMDRQESGTSSSGHLCAVSEEMTAQSQGTSEAGAEAGASAGLTMEANGRSCLVGPVWSQQQPALLRWEC